jgi:drug/metabolite transporter (DMT)-like permease
LATTLTPLDRAIGSPTTRGVAAGFLCYFLFSSADACIKSLGGRMSVFEIIFFVTAAHFLTIGVAKPAAEEWRDVFRMHRPALVAARAACGIGGGLCSVYAFTTLPLAEAYALIFLMPAFATMLSIPLLGEEVGWRRWTAVAVGFVGVLLVIKPGFRELHLGHLAAAGGAVFGALSMIILRTIGATEKRITLLAVIYTAATTVNGVLMIPTFTTPALADLGIIALAGLAGGAGQIAIITAARLAPASRVASAQYSQIVWAVIFGAVFFAEFPDRVAFAGMVLVALSGLFTFLREEQLHGWSRRIILMRNRPDEF